MRDPATPRVFLSYSRKDGLEFARRLQAVLEAEGLSLYRDLSDLDGGEDWWRQVETAIKSVEHVVLVLTPSALQSRYVRDEWKLARQEGKAMWPVSGPSELDLSHLPRWMVRANRHDIDIPESRDRLILGLKGPAREKRVPFMADPLPAGFVERPEKFAEIKKKLLDAQGEPVAITAALRGAGGFGKTALANALCHDPEIEDAFSDGILRVVLGEKPEDLVSRVADLIEILTGERPGVTQLEGAKAKFAEALDDRRCLLVIDDAWREQDLAPFLHRGPRDQTTRLITTRNDRVLPAEATRVAVDAMTSDQALAMLTRGLPAKLPSTFDVRLAALAERLGEWPLLLGLANGVLCARAVRGSSVYDALGYVERALVQRGFAAAFPTKDRATRRSTAWGTLEVSLEELSERERTRFAELAVFVEDAEIPTGAALGLWRQTAGLDSLDGENLLTRLAELSLLTDLNLGRGLFRLHDVFRDLLRSGPAKNRLAELDAKLIAHFRASCPSGNLAQLKDSYGLRYSIAHLRGAGESEAADLLLQDPMWMQAKLNALGVQPLLADYVGQPLQTAPFAIGAALTLAATALASRPRELPAQLLARLAPEDAPSMERCLRTVHAHLAPPTLVPLRASFTPPGAEQRRFEGHRYGVTSVSVLPDGRRALSGGQDGTLRLWDLDIGVELHCLHAHTYGVTAMTVLADGRRVLSGSSNGTLRLWDLESGAELRCLDRHPTFVTSLAVLSDGEHVLSGSNDGTLQLWDLETSSVIRNFMGHGKPVTCIAALTDGRLACAGYSDGTLHLWDLETAARLRTFDWGERVNCMAVLVDGRRAISGSELRLWDLETGAMLRRFEGQFRVTSVAVFGDGRRALSGSDDGTLRVWDIETGAELRRLEGHGEGVTGVAVVADNRVLSGSNDGTLRLWNLETGADRRRFGRHEGSVTSLAMLPDGRSALAGSVDHTVRLWDLETGTELRRFKGHEDAVTSVMVLADGRRAVSGSADKTLRIWDMRTGSELLRFKVTDSSILSMTVLLGGRRALVGSLDRTLRLWDLETCAELLRFPGHTGEVRSLVALADGRRALSGSFDGIRIWDLETGAELRSFKGPEFSVTSLAVLADGRRALSGTWNGTVRLWDIENGAELRCFEGHTRAVTSVRALGDGRAVSASEDKTLRLWNLETGAELSSLTFDVTPSSLACSARRKAMVVGDQTGRLHVIELLDRPSVARA